MSRAQPTAETIDALRSLLDEPESTVVTESDAEQDVQEATADEAESMDSHVVMLLDQLQAAQERAAYAEQQALHAQQQVAQQFAAQPARAAPQAVIAHDEQAVSAHPSSFATWAGWCVAVLVAALSAGVYVTSYRPLREQLAAQIKLLDLQARRSRETEASLRRSFDREREVLDEQLSAARATAAASSAPVAADAPTTHQPAADSDGHASATKAAKLEAHAAKREAWLAKKAERAAKREAREAKHTAHAAASADGGGDSDKSLTSKPKHNEQPAAHDTDDEAGGNDPLEGL